MYELETQSIYIITPSPGLAFAGGSSVKMSIEMFLFVLNTFMYMTSCEVIGVLGAV